MKRKIEVKIDDYKSYLFKNKSNKLDKNYEIYTNGGFPKFLKLNEEEIFDGLETDYEIINSEEHILIKFETNSGVEYRFDLFIEPGTGICHIGFSLFESPLGRGYHIVTNKKESLEVFNRIIWILKDIDKKLDIDEYCIGATGTQKDIIYEYMMKFVSGWEKRQSDQYDLGWALYFKL